MNKLGTFSFVLLLFAGNASPLLLPDGFRGGAEIATGQFLVASQMMRDPRFHQSVIFLIQHGAKGSMGIVINRPTKSTVQEFLPGLKGLSKNGERLFYGGPVSTEQLFFLLRDNRKPKGSNQIMEDVHVTSSTKVVTDWLNGKTPEDKLRVFLGYAGWLPGQLAAEIVEGSWALVKADSKSIFERDPAELWRELDVRSRLLQTTNHMPSFFSGSSLAGPGMIIP